MVSEYIWQELLEQDFPEIDLQLVADIPTGLGMVDAGTVTAMIANRAAATHRMRQLGLTNLHVVGETDYVARYGFATRTCS